ncbi:MAG: hypothetical protein KAI83_18825 [Thiomargarita sp.]|nr:hypothetical protein [Thiomargarita sp.]
MKNAISIECPIELLLSLHINIEDFGELVKIQSAISLFKESKISSGSAMAQHTQNHYSKQWQLVPFYWKIHKMILIGKCLYDDDIL